VEVDRGVRATLSFKVFSRELAAGQGAVEAAGPTATEAAPEAAGVAIPRDAAMLALQEDFTRGCEELMRGLCPTGFGLILSHGYNLHADSFKGEDATAWSMLKRLGGAQLVVVPVMIHQSAAFYFPNHCHNTAETTVRALRDEDIRHVTHMRGGPAAPAPLPVIAGGGNGEDLLANGKLPFFFLSRLAYEVRHRHTPYIGNDCQPSCIDSIYVQRAVIVRPR
jgi:hypothetical protein